MSNHNIYVCNFYFIYIALDKIGYQVYIYLVSPWKTYVVGTHLKYLSEALQMSSTTYVFMAK